MKGHIDLGLKRVSNVKLLYKVQDLRLKTGQILYYIKLYFIFFYYIKLCNIFPLIHCFILFFFNKKWCITNKRKLLLGTHMLCISLPVFFKTFF